MTTLLWKVDTWYLSKSFYLLSISGAKSQCLRTNLNKGAFNKTHRCVLNNSIPLGYTIGLWWVFFLVTLLCANRKRKLSCAHHILLRSHFVLKFIIYNLSMTSKKWNHKFPNSLFQHFIFVNWKIRDFAFIIGHEQVNHIQKYGGT